MQKNLEIGRRTIHLRGYNYAATGYYFVTICTNDRMPIFGTIQNGKMNLSRYGHIAKHIWKRGKRIWKNIHLDSFVVMPDHIHMIISIKFVMPREIIHAVGATPRVARSRAMHINHEISPRVARSRAMHINHEISPRVAPNQAMHINYAAMMNIDAVHSKWAQDVSGMRDAVHSKWATQGVARTRSIQAKGPARQSVGAMVGSYKSAVARVIHQMGYLNQNVWHRNFYEKIICDPDHLYRTREYIKNNPKNWGIKCSK